MSSLQLNSKNNALGLLFRTILCLFCFLSFVATDGKGGNGLKLEKVDPTFSSFNAISPKNTKTLVMGCYFVKYSIGYSLYSL